MNIEEQRQAIREGLARTLCENRWGKWEAAGRTAREDYYAEADVALAFLTDKGAALKVEGALPGVDDAYKDFGGNDSIWEDSQQAMVDAGYTRTAPLIEPEKPH